ncbi:phosphate acetyltransferase [Candidatus Woesearchaeota archaeon]|jgi:phosphate acetyltransferase|nr:phosphate acetyltransferase [Candidatus Woesearchaeota archaeon]
MDFLKKIKNKASKNPAKIVFPESTEPRTLSAIQKIIKLNYAKPVLLCSEKKLAQALKKNKLPNSLIKKVILVDYLSSSKQAQIQFNKHVKFLFKLRKKKGLTIEQANILLKDPIYFATTMVKMGFAEALISGATNTTAHTIRPALQIIKTKERFHRVSGLFLMELQDRLILFADCAVNINPDAKTLAEIAIDSWNSAKDLGLNPKIALLSFSTHGSANYDELAKIQKAIKIVNKKHPKIKIDGDLQVDAALVPSVQKLKAPLSPLKGNANVLIFPNLYAGNISYKLVERLAHAKAIGPFLQGLSMPVNDLSRGCSVNDIVELAALTSVQVLELKNSKNKSNKNIKKIKQKN